MNRFLIDGQYKEVLSFHGIDVAMALRKAGLPEDAFSHRSPSMTPDEYFRFADAVSSQICDPQVTLKIASSENIEKFSPPIFAAYCSRNGRIFIERLAKYKKLICPLIFTTKEESSLFSLEIATDDQQVTIPAFLLEIEIVFILNMIRLATKENVSPIELMLTSAINENAFSDFVGCTVKKGSRNIISFSLSDLDLPFISRNDAIWDYFEPELKRRLSELEKDDSYAARVQSALTEMLPGGQTSILDVADKLGVSKRTLQRKLSAENTSFQQQLSNTRELLAKHYLASTDMTSDSIAFLLGFQELNSFLRAFKLWTGMNLHEFRQQ